MKNGFENNNTPKPIRPDALDTSPNQLTMSKADIVNSLCQVADYGEDNPHPQVCALMDTQRWLDAHMSYQTLPDTLFFSFPALTDRCYCGLPPSAPRWGQVPGVVRRLKFPFDCCSDENRRSCSYSRNRCSHSTSRHRHSGSRCWCHDRPHGLWGGATFQMQKYYFQIII